MQGDAKQSVMELLWGTSQLSGGNAAYVEELYEEYLHNPNDVPEESRSYFDRLPRVTDSVTQDTSHSVVREYFQLLGKRRSRPIAAPGSGGINVDHERKQIKVVQLISSYRFRGHQKAKLD